MFEIKNIKTKLILTIGLLIFLGIFVSSFYFYKNNKQNSQRQNINSSHFINPESEIEKSKEQILATIDTSYLFDSRDGYKKIQLDYELKFNPDGKQFAFRSLDGDGNGFMVINGKKIENEYDIDSFDFSPNGQHIIYLAAEKGIRFGKQFMVIDGVEGDKFDSINRYDYKIFPYAVAYVASVANKDLLIINDFLNKNVSYIGKPYDNILDIYSSLKGELIAYSATNIDGLLGSLSSKNFIVINGIEKKYDTVDSIFVDPNGKHVNYIIKKDDKYFLIKNSNDQETEISLKYSGCGYYCSNLTFSPDNTRFAYVSIMGNNNEHMVIIDNIKSRTFYAQYTEIEDSMTINNLIFSNDNKQFAYLVNDSSNSFAVINNKEGEKYDKVYKFIFSSDGQHYAYLGTKDGKDFMILDGEKRKEYDYINKESLRFSEESKFVSFGARLGDKLLWVIDSVKK